jgi:hypothetical protein
MSALCNVEFGKLLKEARARAVAIVEAKRDQRATYVPILPGEPVEDMTAPETTSLWLAVIHDLLGLGPCGFHEPSVRRLASHASSFLVISGAFDLATCGLFATLPGILGCVMIVETTPALYAAWKRFLSEHSLTAPRLVRQAEGVRS